MYQKLPYYMAYPIQTEYDERAERTDLEYMKSLVSGSSKENTALCRRGM